MGQSRKFTPQGVTRKVPPSSGLPVQGSQPSGGREGSVPLSGKVSGGSQGRGKVAPLVGPTK